MSCRFCDIHVCVEKDAVDKIKNSKKISKSKGIEFDRLRAAYDKTKKWKYNTVIKVSFFNNGDSADRTPLSSLLNQRDQNGDLMPIDPIEKKIVNMSPEKAIEYVVLHRIQPLVNLKFEFIKEKENRDNFNSKKRIGDIRIDFVRNSGAYSYLGIDSIDEDLMKEDPVSMNFGWLDGATIIHEFLHALGAIHEHQNPDGNTIDWNKSAVYDYYKSTQGWDKEEVDINILDKYDIDQLNTTKYDPKSIMLYFYPGKLTKDGKAVEQNLRMSKTDCEFLNKMYPTESSIDIENYYTTIYPQIDKKKGILSTYSINNNSKTKNTYIYIIIGIITLVIVVVIISIILYKKFK